MIASCLFTSTQGNAKHTMLNKVMGRFLFSDWFNNQKVLVCQTFPYTFLYSVYTIHNIAPAKKIHGGHVDQPASWAWGDPNTGAAHLQEPPFKQCGFWLLHYSVYVKLKELFPPALLSILLQSL